MEPVLFGVADGAASLLAIVKAGKVTKVKDDALQLLYLFGAGTNALPVVSDELFM